MPPSSGLITGHHLLEERNLIWEDRLSLRLFNDFVSIKTDNDRPFVDF
jgi:hypothetical protein